MFPSNSLTTGKNNPLLPELVQAIYHADSIYIASAFIQMSGIRLLQESIIDALNTNKNVKIITSDYLDITDPNALRFLMILQSLGANVKVFETGNAVSFHIKAYIFTKNHTGEGCAYVGSSNISKSALVDGFEWNAKISSDNNPETFSKILTEYDEVLIDPRCINLTHEWIDQYINRRNNQSVIPQFVDDAPTPNLFQTEALRELARSRSNNKNKGLIVLATGLGKTWLAAFDVKAFNANKILFVAHREEILNQAEATFSTLLPEKRSGRFSAESKDFNADILFAQVQSLGKNVYLNEFQADHFDYIIIDEFHHAAAASYLKVINHFSPKFLLGLTATPDRTDSKEIYTLCDNNLIYKKSLFDGIRKKLLSPFTYRGIAEHESVNYGEIPWRNGKFDPNELTAQFATKTRAEHNYQKWQEYKLDKTLAFCVSIKHADYMSDYFHAKGVKSVSLHSDSQIKRGEAIEQLKLGKIEIIFTVDLFNEGVDIPEINTILMLRPTDSSIVFLQQLGRGLRLCENKSHLEIIDFIGNHISFFKKPEALFEIESNNESRKSFLADIKEDNLLLPDNCFVNYEPKAIDFMQGFISNKSDLQLEKFINLKEQIGRRPTLSEFWKAGGSISTIRNSFGSWFDFLIRNNELESSHEQTYEEHSNFINEIEITSRQKSFKFITLLAMSKIGFANPINQKELSEESYKIIHGTDFAQVDIPNELQVVEDSKTPEGWEKYWLKNPINAWLSGAYFESDGTHIKYSQNIDPNHIESFNFLIKEVVAYRLDEYRSTIEINSTAPEALILHKEYMRADIPPLFGHEFNEAIWNSGFVTPKGFKDIYLLVTLDKSGKSQEHQYSDYFIDNRTFFWQSQNSNEPRSGKGKRLLTHKSDGAEVHLFVRNQGKLKGGTAAPFYSCGTVTYISHEGAKPMNVRWKLDTALPENLMDIFN